MVCNIINVLDFVNEANWAGELWRGIWQAILGMIYSLVGFLCQGFTLMYQTTIFGESIIEQFSQRIYIVLGVYMLFKLTFSLLTSIVSPEKMFDKEAGMQKIITRTIVSLFLLIATPTIFNLAISEQVNIAKTVPKIILGKTGSSNMADDGEVLASTALTAFITPSSLCSSTTELQSNLTISDVLGHATDVCSSNREVFAYDFNWFIGIICGIIMMVFMASYTVDMAIRAIKLGILRVIAPIPIISYIDPKSSKDGAFSHWVKESVSTYLQLFIKLAVLYLILYLLSGLSNSSLDLIVLPSGTTAIQGAYIKVFIIIGAFMFMGKASAFICNLIGIKPDESGLLGGLAGIAAAGGILSSGINSVKAKQQLNEVNGKPRLGWNKGKSIKENLSANAKALPGSVATGLLGAGAGLLTGTQVAAKSKGGFQGFKDVNSAINRANTDRMSDALNGKGVLSHARDAVDTFFSNGSGASLIENQLKAEKGVLDYVKSKGTTKAGGLTLGNAMAGNRQSTKNNLDKLYGKLSGLSAVKYFDKAKGLSSDFNMNKFLTEATGAQQRAENGGRSTFGYGGVTWDVNDSTFNVAKDELSLFFGSEWTNMNRGAIGADGKLTSDAMEIDTALTNGGYSNKGDIIYGDVKDNINKHENDLSKARKDKKQ